MRPIVSKEKLPEVFFYKKRDRYQKARRSLAHMPYEQLYQMDLQIEDVSLNSKQTDNVSMQSLAILNTQRGTPSFGGGHMEMESH